MTPEQWRKHLRHLPKNNVTLLINERRENILSALRDLAAKSAPGDLILFFYAGQEAVLENKFYLLPTKGDRKPIPANIEFSEIESTLKDTKASTVVAILDTCRTGRASFSPAFKPQNFILAAAGYGGTAIDDEGQVG